MFNISLLILMMSNSQFASSHQEPDAMMNNASCYFQKQRIEEEIIHDANNNYLCINYISNNVYNYYSANNLTKV